MLITKEELQDHRAISKSVKASVINSFIEDAEIQDLVPLLGEKLYFDIVKNPANYADLLDGCNYVYDEVTIKNPGLKKVLAIFVNAKYIMFGNQSSTPFGTVEKNYQDGHHIERASRKERYKLEQQTAFIYWEQVKIYLDRNTDDYEFWAYGCSNPRRTFRLNKITIN